MPSFYTCLKRKELQDSLLRTEEKKGLTGAEANEAAFIQEQVRRAHLGVRDVDGSPGKRQTRDTLNTFGVGTFLLHFGKTGPINNNLDSAICAIEQQQQKQHTDIGRHEGAEKNLS